MTDFAYEVMLAAAKYSNGEALPPDLQSLFKRLSDQIPGLTQFYADAAKAIPKPEGPAGRGRSTTPTAKVRRRGRRRIRSNGRAAGSRQEYLKIRWRVRAVHGGLASPWSPVVVQGPALAGVPPVP